MYDVLAMIRQLGLPTWFLTLSAADMQLVARRHPDHCSTIWNHSHMSNPCTYSMFNELSYGILHIIMCVIKLRSKVNAHLNYVYIFGRWAPSISLILFENAFLLSSLCPTNRDAKEIPGP